jgi:drug/metabolite transporter (DMT)-like permease
MNDERKHRLDGLAVVLLVGCCAVWGLAQVAAKVSLAEVPPLTQGGLRSLGAALLLALWARVRGLKLWQRDGSARAGLLLGVLFAAEFACLFVGLQFTSASRMVVFLYCSPFVVALLMPLLARSERLDRVQLLGLVVAFVGVVVTYSEGFGTAATAGPLQWLGDALGLAGAVLWALTTLALRASRLAHALPEKTLMYQLVVSAVALGVAAPLAGEAWPAQISSATWWGLGFQTVVVTFASYLVWFWLVRHYPATRISAFTLLTPVFGLLAGVVLLGEPATARLLLGLVAVCAGIALVNRTSRPT